MRITSGELEALKKSLLTLQDVVKSVKHSGARRIWNDAATTIDRIVRNVETTEDDAPIVEPMTLRRAFRKAQRAGGH